MRQIAQAQLLALASSGVFSLVDMKRPAKKQLPRPLRAKWGAGRCFDSPMHQGMPATLVFGHERYLLAFLKTTFP